MTRHLMYLQLRRDMLEDRVACTPDQAMSIAAVAMQAEYGDLIPDLAATNYMEPDNYLSPGILRRTGMTYARDNLPTMHQEHAGREQEEAELRFVEVGSLVFFVSRITGGKGYSQLLHSWYQWLHAKVM